MHSFVVSSQRRVAVTLALGLLLSADVTAAQQSKPAPQRAVKPTVASGGAASQPSASAPSPASRDRAPAAPANSEYWPLAWRALSGFYIDPFTPVESANNIIPKRVWEFDGEKVALTGYVIPFDFSGSGITQFALTESLDACGYGENLTPTNWVSTRMKPGKTAPYSQFQVLEVFGTLRIGAVWDSGRLSSLYWLTADSARLAR